MEVAQKVLDILETDNRKSRPEKQEPVWEPIVCADDTLVLRKVTSSDREGFLRLQREYFVMKSTLKEEIFRNEIWKDHLDSKK